MAVQGMWRTPHPSPDIGNSTKGLSGAVAIAMAYLTDGTVVFAERPHPLADGITNNPLIVNVSPSLLSPCCDHLKRRCRADQLQPDESTAIPRDHCSRYQMRE